MEPVCGDLGAARALPVVHALLRRRVRGTDAGFVPGGQRALDRGHIPEAGIVIWAALWLLTILVGAALVVLWFYEKGH